MKFKRTLSTVALIEGAESHSAPGETNLPSKTSVITSLVVCLTTGSVSLTTERGIYIGSIRKDFK